jgi:hypothetical protein
MMSTRVTEAGDPGVRVSRAEAGSRGLSLHSISSNVIMIYRVIKLIDRGMIA